MEVGATLILYYSIILYSFGISKLYCLMRCLGIDNTNIGDAVCISFKDVNDRCRPK